MSELNNIKLNLGAGNDIKSGYVNHDIVKLEGIDVVHDLENFPWPWPDNYFDEVFASDILEHLDDFILTMEQIYRVLKPGGKLLLKVPYWNSVFAHIDPTHKRGFHENTFHFFDPTKIECKTRPYYTDSRFEIIDEAYIIILFSPYLPIPGLPKIKIKNKIAKRIVGFIGNNIFSNIILDLEIGMKKL